VNAGRTTSRKSQRGRDKPSDVNIVLNCLFDLVALLSDELGALSFVLCHYGTRDTSNTKEQSSKHKAQGSAECGWNYIPYKDEDPGSNPGGPLAIEDFKLKIADCGSFNLNSEI
jgi:hypothetical protein